MGMKILFGVILVSLGTIQSKSVHTEPMCTRFAYDELLLEKMIKTEHKTDVMMDTFHELSVEVKSDLESMKGEFDKIQKDAKALSTEGHDNIENMKSQFDEMIKEQVEKIRESVLAETEKYKTEISEMRETVQAEAEKYKKEISDLKEQVAQSSYAFSAYWVSKTNPSPAEDLIFTRTLLDTDGVYNNRTGKYTVPHSGVYIFFATLCANSGKYAYVDFHNEETFIGRIRTGDTDWTECSSGSAIAHLQSGKQVSMRVTQTNLGKVFYNSESYRINSFSGHLIKLD